MVIYRLPRGESVVYPPSHCPLCRARLKPADLVPLVSWLLLQGKCRYCGGRIPVRYPLVELATGMVFLILASRFYGWQLVSLQVLAAVLISAAVIDYRHGIIPNSLVLAGFVLGLGLSFFNPVLGWQQHLLGVIAGGGPLLALAVLSRGGMGGGDIKLAAVMGLFLGPRLVLLALCLGSLLAGLAGMVLLLLGKKGRKDTLVFGPFLAAGAFAAIMWGQQLVAWYLSRL